MEETTQIQQGTSKNVNSVNQDTTIKIELSSSKNILTENDIQNVIDVTQLFETERQNIDKYRIHGEIEYLSILNGLITTYSGITDYFTRQPLTVDTKSILTDLNIYLAKPLPPSGTTLFDGVTESTGYTTLYVVSTGNKYVKNYEIISELTNIDLFRVGFSTNIFNEKQYAFIFDIDFDLTDVYDGINFPLDQLYLYIEYQPTENRGETMERKGYDANGDTAIESFIPTTLNIGDIIVGDVIQHNLREYTQTILNTQEHYIYTPYSGGTLKWKYSPFIPIKIRYFSDDLQRVNISGTSVINTASIPSYASSIDDDGNYVWRNLLNKGFVDPLTGDGVNFPFMNNRHYVFINEVLTIQPDLIDATTQTIFSSINFDANTFISTKPTGDLTTIGELC